MSKRLLKILCVVGTRPEAIKMAPVILELKRCDWASCIVVATGQHKDLLYDTLSYFDITPDIDLGLMEVNQSLPRMTARLLEAISTVLDSAQPDIVLAQGDTTTVMTTSLACFYDSIPFGHIEAGLRTGSITEPFPEEANRVICGLFASWHFAPTETARTNLVQAGVPEDRIWVTGNTVIDSLLMISEQSPLMSLPMDDEARLVLITAHRRENFGLPFDNICSAIETLANEYPRDLFLYPVHPNPRVYEVAHRRLNGIRNVNLCPPLNYREFVAALKRSFIVITDSGGIQEEAPALGKPVVVLRNHTERPEAVKGGVATLVGTDIDRITDTVRRLLDDQHFRQSMVTGSSPYGDGLAAERIVSVLKTAHN